ncbi:class I SAM-dependent methyltransferase [Nocardioides taihuensis]|uniref:Class I SAM-dependent methyltransferase n=1 Tax=Nocardioides taihuensis TaxID=1835606 RepID=A0ABW0BIL5_9ACTN
MTASDDGRQAHWEDVYSSKGVDEVSWFQRDPEVSLRLVAGAPGSVVDVGAGASVLVDRLLEAGRTDVTLLDLSPAALTVTRERLGPAADGVTFVAADVVGWDPDRTFDCWHDRAVFHFLTDPARQAAYVATAGRLVAPRGAVVLGTFAADGPTQCSGLPTARHEPADLATLFAHDFDLEHAERETHRTPWGAEQHFTWVVLRRR